MAKPLTLVAVGDITPNRADPPSIFKHCIDEFRKGDIVFGHLEGHLSDRGTPTTINPRRLPPINVTALTDKGARFDVMSHASNHAMHFGWEAFYQTLDICKENNVPLIGVGRNIVEARKPYIVERDGTKVGFLAYLSIFPVEILLAEEDLPGCAPLRATHSMQVLDHQPGVPPYILTELYPEDKAAMIEDIKKLRSQVDVLVVSMHCGVHFVPALIAQYQKEAAYAAIDAGADLILQHHAHILKGVEVYKGKAIFYGMGNFAAEQSLDSSGKTKMNTAERNIRKKLFGIRKPVPGYENKHVGSADALKTMMVKAYIQDKKITKVTYIPAHINTNLEPVVVTAKEPMGQEIFDYVAGISESQELKVKFSWEGNEILVGA